MGGGMDDEKTALLAFLRQQHQHILGAIEGLADDDLRRPVLPSAWSILGLVQHLTYDVEQFWFQCVQLGKTDEFDFERQAWEVADELPAADVIAAYRQAIAQSVAVIEQTPLDALPLWWPDFFGDMPVRTLRKNVLHVMTETATHAGHLDAMVELIDKRQWLVLT